MARSVAVFILGLLALAPLWAAQDTVPPPSDVRVLIDVSGSMKKNDPANLRVPALRLLSGLLPKGAPAGIWFFGDKIETAMPYKTVDKAWLTNASAASRRVHYRGLFTNIGEAIHAASQGWEAPELKTRRSIILLTDGVLDVSKEPGKNEAARRQLLEQDLPRLKRLGAKIHTIALSRDADKELLARLAGATDGLAEQADSPEDLQRIFLKIFEQATSRDSLPLTDNRFNVDAHIEEFTLLAFRKSDGLTQLIAPDGSRFSAKAPGKTMRWHSDAAYDLVTVEKPAAGLWRLEGALDPANRVMVVSKLSLRTPDIPNNLLAGESITFAASLVEDGQPIKRKDFLQLVEFSLSESRDGKTEQRRLQDDGQGGDSVTGDGRYTTEIEAGSEEITLELVALAKSATFERRRSQTLKVYGAPFDHEFKLAQGEETAHHLLITPKAAVVDRESLQLRTHVKFPDGTAHELPLKPGEGEQLVMELPASGPGGEYQIVVHAEGRTATGRSFKVASAPIAVVIDALPGQSAAAKTEPAAPSTAEGVPASAPAAEETLAQTPEAEQDKSINWPMWIGLGLGLNVILVVCAYLLARLLKKRRLAAAAELAGDLGE